MSGIPRKKREERGESKDIKIYYFSITILILFGIYMLFSGNANSELTSKTPVFSPNPDVDKVIMALLHGNHRCTSCINMENWTEKTIETYFSKEREEGKIEFLVLNYEDPQNKEAVERYSNHPFVSIYSETIIHGESKIENIEDAWYYQTNEKKFIEFMKNYIEGLMENDQ